MNPQAWLDEIRAQYRQLKDWSERAAAQVGDAAFFQPLGGCPVSLAGLMKHVGGNNRSRWRDFLTTDGEKRDRDRETEFSVEGDTRASVQARWEEGWSIAFEHLERLTPADLERTVTIRGQPHSVLQAVHRNLNHAAYHTGQIVLLARQHAGEAWQTLSIAQGESEAHNARMRDRFGDWWAKEEGEG